MKCFMVGLLLHASSALSFSSGYSRETRMRTRSGWAMSRSVNSRVECPIVFSPGFSGNTDERDPPRQCRGLTDTSSALWFSCLDSKKICMRTRFASAFRDLLIQVSSALSFSHENVIRLDTNQIRKFIRVIDCTGGS